MAKARRFLPSAFGASVLIHAAFLALVLIWAGLQPEELASKAPPIRTDLVFLEHTGVGGGGGGNPAPAPAPPKPMEIPPHQTPAIPVTAVPMMPEPPKLVLLDAPIQTTLATMLQATGVTLQAPPGPGGGGAGTGLGLGAGPGVKDGSGGNTGGGPRRLGDGVTSPEPILRVKPQYTNAAMQARISGTATVEAIVLANGTVGDVKIVGSLDKIHGLDLEALKAARQWTFKPGTFEGKAVDVIVRIALEFNLR